MGDPIKMPEEGKGYYTYADYLKWPEGERWELINGVPFNMSPAPKRKHQDILTQLFGRLWEELWGNLIYQLKSYHLRRLTRMKMTNTSSMNLMGFGSIG